MAANKKVKKSQKATAAPNPEPTNNQLADYKQPGFLDALNESYALEGKNVVVFNGNKNDLYWSETQQAFLDIEETLYHKLKDTFTTIRLDTGGIESYTKEKTEIDHLARVCKLAEETVKSPALGDLKQAVNSALFTPLESIVLLRQILQAVTAVRLAQKQKKEPEEKPVCIVIQLADAIFPSGDFSQLAELDRLRLVEFLKVIESRWFKESAHLIILLAESTTSINSQIVGLPSVRPIQIGFPSDIERAKFIQTFPAIEYEKGPDKFVADSAGLTLTALEALLHTASRNEPHLITRKALIEQVNRVVKSKLGESVSIEIPDHGPEDIIGYAENKKLLAYTFERSENPKTAASVIIASGPNGAGKSFQFEAYAKVSGRVIIRLANMRGKYFGETEATVEKLRMLLSTVGKALILIDEADTFLGDARGDNTHEVEKRLVGTFIQMMSNADGKAIYVCITSRPDKLPPDIKSRAGVQVPVFDLQREERKEFVKMLFERADLHPPEVEWDDVLKKTDTYSARDYANLVKEVKSRKHTSILETLTVWRAPALSIKKDRRMQTLIAALHCSEIVLLPPELKEQIVTGETDAIEEEIETLKRQLKR